MPSILIVDDDEAFRDTLAETLESLGHEVTQAADGYEALERLERARFAMIFLDQRMPGMDGLQVLAAMREQVPRLPPVILLTAHSSSDNTIEAMRLGALDHLTKPIGRDAVQKALALGLAQGDGREAAQATTPADQGHTDEFVGVSDAMRDVHKRIGLAAASDAPVLILGETGTGKEMVARALHRHSARRSGPFVAINCAAIPKELLESELFGHVRGAFTGAAGDRPGCFRAADRGLLLLDEIGDMALNVQAKILRVLQEGEVTPLGSNRAVKVDVRVAAATHRDLSAAVAEGAFREDLLYRLDVLSIRLPPLRERLADIVPLAEYFLRRLAGGEAHKSLSADAAQALLRHRWPGNVRELQNVMSRCQALVRGSTISAADLGFADREATSSSLPPDWLGLDLPAAIERLERWMIEHALAQTLGNRAETARRLGIHRQLLYKKLTQYGLE